MKKQLIFFFVSLILFTKEVNVYQYEEQDGGYLVLGYETEKELIPEVSIKKTPQNVSKVDLENKSLYVLTKPEDIQKDNEHFLLGLFERDNKEEFIRFMREDRNRELLVKKMSVVSVFKYPLHQAILNKSYKILDLMLSYGNLGTIFVEESGRTTWDIFEIVDHRGDIAMNKLYKKYKLKFKTEENK